MSSLSASTIHYKTPNLITQTAKQKTQFTKPIYHINYPFSKPAYTEKFSMSSVGRNQFVKVVIINTKYVETDAMSFKDVVQRLTGKDSRVAYEVQEPITKSPQYSLKEGAHIGRTGNNVLESSNTSIASTMSRSSSSVLMRNISFKEFERLFREMPPMEEFLAEQ